MTTPKYPRPEIGGTARRDHAASVRHQANRIARQRHAPVTSTNGEEVAHAPVWPLNFTKGLPHDAEGFVDPSAYALFVDNINVADDGNPMTFEVPLGPNDAAKVAKTYRPKGYTPGLPDIPDAFTCLIAQDSKTGATNVMPDARAWESPRAGHVADLQGADADALATDAAPALGSDELTAEMAEAYGLALLRDVPFQMISGGDTQVKPAGVSAADVIGALGALPFFKPDAPIKESYPGALGQTGGEPLRRQARFEADGQFTSKVAFRGSTPGAKMGPYLSQFLLVGTGGNVSDGLIGYGANVINQRVATFTPGRDYMTDFNSWLDVQLGANVGGQQVPSNPRFMVTPRDLASYVRIDQLYQAYLNAALILAGQGLDFDEGLPDGNVSITRAPFATFGGPHLLALLTEVSSRGLKTVRRQKFNYHRRGRPERLGAMVDKVGNGDVERFTPTITTPLAQMYRDLANIGLTDWIATHNAKQLTLPHPLTNIGGGGDRSLMLPMAFIEGSPMHPAYGAGHATVAGACVTVLKAFFQMFEDEPGSWIERKMGTIGLGTVLEPNIEMNGTQIDHVNSGQRLVDSEDQEALTIQGELDKLAANISIGRNMAGVHFYTDYYESLRLGERITVTILEEQMLTYPEPVRMRFHSFDRDQISIERHTDGTVSVDVQNADGHPVAYDIWLARQVSDPKLS